MNALTAISLQTHVSPFQNSEGQTPKPSGDCLDHLKGCFSDRDNLNDFFIDPIVHFLDWFSQLSLDDLTRKEVTRIRKGVDLVASVLSIPVILDYATKFKRHVYALKESWTTHCSLQDQRVSHLFKKVTLDALNIANNVSETALFLNNVEVVDLKGTLPVVDAFYQVSNFVIDGWDIMNQVEKVQKYQSSIDETDSKSTKNYFEKKKAISFLRITRDVFSIGLSIIGMVSIIYGLMVQSLFFLPPLALTFSTLYLLVSILIYISKKNLEEQKKPELVKI